MSPSVTHMLELDGDESNHVNVCLLINNNLGIVYIEIKLNLHACPYSSLLLSVFICAEVIKIGLDF